MWGCKVSGVVMVVGVWGYKGSGGGVTMVVGVGIVVREGSGRGSRV